MAGLRDRAARSTSSQAARNRPASPPPPPVDRVAAGERGPGAGCAPTSPAPEIRAGAGGCAEPGAAAGPGSGTPAAPGPATAGAAGMRVAAGARPGPVDGPRPADAAASCGGAVMPPVSARRSNRSRRTSNADGSDPAVGSNARAMTSSSSSRGLVVPRISLRPACTTSAARESSAGPIRPHWPRIRSIWSSE